VIKKIVVHVGGGILLGFVAFFTFRVFNLIFLDKEPSALAALYASFFGAFFAFLFIRLGEALTRIYERKAKNHTTLIELQHIHNANIVIMDDNRYMCNKLLEAFTKVTQDGVPIIVPNKLKPVQSDFERLTRLTNLDIINDLFRFYTNVRKFNDDIESFNESYRDICADYRAKAVDLNVYKMNIPRFLFIIKALSNFLGRMHDENLRALATLRAFSNDSTLLGQFIRLVTQDKIDARKKREIDKHLEKLQKELDESAA